MTTPIGIPQSSPTLDIKSIETNSIPEIASVSEEDFRKYVPTGITITINTPFIKNSRDAIFGINIDGFIPQYNMQSYTQALKNHLPVQVFPHALSFCTISQEMCGIPAMVNYLSHRFVSGNVGLGLRITSNTSQPGNMLVSQASGCAREYYPALRSYTGLRFMNISPSSIDFAQNSFAVVDFSLIRNLSITTLRHDPLKKQDLAMKLLRTATFLTPSGENQIQDYNNFASQFLEDWLLFTPLTSFPNSIGSQIHISVFFDFSTVQFETPLLPFVPFNTLDSAKQILLYSTSFNLLNPDRASLLFLPGVAIPDSAPLLTEEQEEKLEEINKKLAKLSSKI